ncbi:MAG: hypothetical protein ABFR36_00440 [Acidobacteriota bacterium]
MMITKSLSLEELAFVVCKVLKDNGVDAVLTGGAVVAIYSDNLYMSYDLDFVTHSSLKEIDNILKRIGFVRKGRSFFHSETDYYLDFPAPPLSVGDKPVDTFNEITKKNGYLKLLTPTHCVMDRLASYYYWDDNQALTQAVMVSSKQKINLVEIKEWSENEGMSDKYAGYVKELKKYSGI